MNDDTLLDDWLASLSGADPAAPAATPPPVVETADAVPPTDTPSAEPRVAPPDETMSTLLDRLHELDLPLEVASSSAESASAPAPAHLTERYLLFTVAGSTYAVLESSVIEVGRVPKTTLVPHTPPWIRGVTNVRGDVLSVVDFRTLLGIEATAAHSARLLVARLAGEELAVGFLVDAVDQIANVARGEVRAPDSPLAGALAEYVLGTCRVGDRFVAVLDVDGLLRSPEIRQFDDQEESSCEARI